MPMSAITIEFFFKNPTMFAAMKSSTKMLFLRKKDNENENPENLLKEVCGEFSKIQ